ncbi:TolC family protein [Mucilaginibacter aquatilis]|uniref:TolC family protein n=1 Tax=Mucilaginibacter aquatilis TaxID=1517760 RepID=A0A6I4IEW2_9SPHI|nr:TolC family protein [Mucilaginibacter aquatilis]MVN92116.1 TolC family protein [Mucilaginibacter aquatilis]
MTTLNNTTTITYAFKRVPKLVRLGILAAATGMLFGSTAYAQERTLTLEEAIKLGLENSKTLKLSQSKIDQAVSQYNQAKDKALPTASASFMYSRAQIPANTLNLGQESLSLPKSANANLGIVSVEEVIYGGGRFRYAKESTDLLVNVAKLDVEKDREQIAYNIVNAYYDLYRVVQSKSVVEQSLKSIDQQIHQAQRFFEQGLVTKNDVLRFQLQRSNIELNGIDLENNRKVINYNLNILLGLPDETQLNVSQIPVAQRTVAPLQSYRDSALSIREELKQQDLRTKYADVNIKNIQAEKLPTLAATAGLYYVNASANPLPNSGKYITPLTAGLALSWNFGSLWTNKNKVNEARIQREETVINKGIITDNIKNEVNQSYQNYMKAVDKIKLLETSIAQANENNRILTSKYANSTASATDRADAETLLYQAQINLELAKADAGLAYYNLLKATGKLTK